MHFKIVPDGRLGVHHPVNLVKGVSALWSAMIDRWNGRGFGGLDRIAWEVVMEDGDAAFYLTVSERWANTFEKQLTTTWPRAALTREDDPLHMQPGLCATSRYKNHYLYSLHVDQRNLDMLDSLLGTLDLLDEDDKVAYQVVMEPVSPEWYQDAAELYERMRKGKPPKRTHIDRDAIVKAGAQAVAYGVLGLVNLVDEIVTGEEGPREKLELTSPGSEARSPRYRVAKKLKSDVVDATVQVAIQCDDPRRAKAILRSVSFALREYDGNNALALDKSSLKNTWKRMRNRKPPVKIVNNDYLDMREAAALICLPSGAMAKKHGIDHIEQRQTKLPRSLTSGGMVLGHCSWRGKRQDVFIPTGDYDELCKPRVCPGQMGAGKTTFGANLVVEAVRQGFTAVALDPQKGDIGEEAAIALGEDKVTRIKLGDRPIALDWREGSAANRVSNEVLSFFRVLAGTDEIGHQTARYLRAAAKAVPGGNLYGIIRMFDDAGYRNERMKALSGFDLRTWEQFNQESDKRQQSYMRPVMNRLDGILGDSYLAACMEAKEGIDLVKYVEQPGHAVVFELPGRRMSRSTKNLLGALISTKLDMSMVLREEEHPVVVVQDEPHQYSKGSDIWRSVAVESRQHRFAYTWLFHSWAQLDYEVREIIQGAGPHYHIFRSSKKTYMSLAEEIAPVTIEEALEMPRWHAINVMQANGRSVEPFICQMAPPPSER